MLGQAGQKTPFVRINPHAQGLHAFDCHGKLFS
jgi:hypothetical protein